MGRVGRRWDIREMEKEQKERVWDWVGQRCCATPCGDASGGGFCAKSLQPCPTLCDPVDSNLPGSSVHGILQARILESVAMPSSRGSFQTRDQTQVSCVSCFHRVLYH